MEVHRPKPWHGWREFAKEIGTIVIGVLIALSAEQAVETLHQRHEIREAREALDKELAWNLMAFEFQNAQVPCSNRRLDELDSWSQRSAAAGHPALNGPIGGPLGISYRSSIWRAVADVVAEMPLEQRLAYAEIYDNLANAEQIRTTEREAWRDMAQFPRGRVLTPEQRARFEADIQAARSANKSLTADEPIYRAPFAKLGIKASPLPQSPLIRTAQQDSCTTLLAG